MPTTPKGTRTWRSSSPLGSVDPRTTSPTGSGSAAVCRSPSAIAAIRWSVSVSRSIRWSAVPLSRAAATSAALAARITGVPATSASAIARNVASLAARLPVRDLFGQWGRTDPVHVPYYLFMHGWVRLFGASEVALRMPSALAVGVAAALIAVLGQLLYRPAVGVLAGVLFALLPAVSR